jgi:hypothetical protein
VNITLPSAQRALGFSVTERQLNTIAVSSAAAYLARPGAAPSAAAATVHGDTAAFTFLVVLFTAGAVLTGLLYPRRAAVAARTPTAARPAAEPARGAVVGEG